MIIPLRAFDPTQKIIWEVVISFSTLLTARLINVSTIPFFIIIGYLIKNGKEVFSLNWTDKITGDKNAKNNILKHLLKALALYLVTYICFYPVDVAILMVESDGVNIKETYPEKSEIDPFSRFGINIEGYKIPIIIGASIASFDFLLYDKDAGIIPYVFGSFYAEYIKDSFTIFKSYDLLMASDNYENMIDIVSNETKETVLNNFKDINKKYAVLGEELFKLKGFSNKDAHNFFINAKISTNDYKGTKNEKTHGYFGDFGSGNSYAEVNIANLKGYTTSYLADKVWLIIDNLKKDALWNKDYIDSEIKIFVYDPINKSMEVLDSIQRSVYSSTLLIDEKNRFISFVEEVRKEIKNSSIAIENRISSDIKNISLIKDFKKQKNEFKQSENFLESSISWIKNIVVSPIVFASSWSDKLFSSTLEIIIFFMFQLIKIIYILIFLYRSVYIGMTVASVSFAMLKALINQNPLIMFSPIKAYCICRLWDFAFILSGLLGYALPYSIARNDFSSWGKTSSGMTLAMSISLIIQIIAMIFFIRKISWILQPETFNDPNLTNSNNLYEENITNSKIKYTNKNNMLSNLYSNNPLENLIDGKIDNNLINHENSRIFSNRASRFGNVSGKRK